MARSDWYHGSVHCSCQGDEDLKTFEGECRRWRWAEGLKGVSGERGVVGQSGSDMVDGRD